MAAFAGDPDYGTSTGNGTLNVLQESATLAYTGDTLALGGAFRLESQVTQDPDGSLGDLNLAGSVEFVLTHASDGTAAGTFVAVVDGAGVAGVNLGGLPARSYDVQVSLPPNNYFSALPVAAVIQTQPVLMVDALSGQYSDSVTLRSTLTADGGKLAGRTVSFTVNGMAVGSGVTDGSGVVTSLYMVNQGAGTYVIAASFAGDGTYSPMNGADNLSVTSEDASLAYTGDLVSDGGQFDLQATPMQALDGSLGDLSLAGSIEFTLTRISDGVVHGVYTGVVNGIGQAATTIGALPADSYSVTAHLVVNDYYQAADLNLTVQGSTSIVMADLSEAYSDTVMLAAVLDRQGGAGLSGKTVTFAVNGVVVGSSVTDAAGLATVPYTVTLGAGIYPIDATFSGDSGFTGSAVTADLTVVHEVATLTYTGDYISSGGSFTLSAQLTQDPDGSLGSYPLAGNIEVTVRRVADGTIHAVQAAAVTAGGTVTVNLGALPADVYDVEVDLLPNNYFAAGMVVARVTAITTLSVNSLNGQYSDVVTLEALLSPAISGMTISFAVNGVGVGSGMTDATGRATLPYTIVQSDGSYPITAQYAGDGNYAASAGSGTLDVLHEDATLAYTGETLTAGGAINLAATLTQSADGSLGNVTLAGSLQFRLARVTSGVVAGTYAGVIDAVGNAATSTGALVNTPYDVETSLPINDYFQAALMTSRIMATPAMAVGGTSGQYSDTITLQATLTDGSGGVAGRSIAFAVNGVAVGSAGTNAGGVASLSHTIVMPAGVYNITATFGGDTAWVAASGSSSLTVSAEDGSVAYTGPSVMQPGIALLSALFSQSADGMLGDSTVGSLSFTALNTTTGVPYGPWIGGMDGTGNTSLAQDLLVEGVYTVAIDMVGNGYFMAAPATAGLTVDGTAPTVPGGLALNGNSCLTYALTWTASTDNLTGVSEYRVYRSVNGGGYILLASVGGLTQSDTTITNGNTYSYVVRAVDGAGNESASSGTASGTANFTCVDMNQLSISADRTTMSTKFIVKEFNTWVQIRYTITGPDNRIIDQWATPQFYAGKGAKDVSSVIAPALAAGSYTLHAEIFAGPDSGVVYGMDTRQITFSVP